MSIPWFPFNIKDFVANTMRLNTEATGAYLRLMLDYYQNEEGPPDDDYVLASTCGLTAEAWALHRRVIAPLFEIKDGRWYHARIEEEIAIACSKLATSRARAAAGAAAMHAKAGHKPAPSQLKAGSKPKTSRKPAPSMLGATSEQCSKRAESTLTSTTLSSSSSAPARQDDDPPKAIEDSKKVEPANPLGTVLPEDWIPGSMEIETAKAYGMSDDDVKSELLIFHALNAQNGTWSKNWGATWQLFCARWKERKATQAKKPAARLELNTTYAPSPSEWDYGARMWARDQSKWPRSLGADPSTGRCRCPPEILKKYGINQTVEEPT